uniref:Bardet-Biedl syndrome 4 protein n=1 Tax=Ascaris suum TaxID=6253 RepID=F1L535_ASCSU
MPSIWIRTIHEGLLLACDGALSHRPHNRFDNKGTRVFGIGPKRCQIRRDSHLLGAKLCAQKNEIIPAIEAYKKALELEPENLDVLTNVGLLYLRTHSEDQAFSILGKALSYDPTHAPSILAAGSIIQANGDYDVALAKYRIAADKCDYNGPLCGIILECAFSAKANTSLQSVASKRRII